MIPFIDVIIEEVRRVRDAYEKECQGKIERVILAAEGEFSRREDYFTKRLELPTVEAPFNVKFLIPPQLEPVVNELRRI